MGCLWKHAILGKAWAVSGIGFVGVEVVGGRNARFRCFKEVGAVIILRPGCCFPALRVFLVLSSRSFGWSSRFLRS